MNNRDLAVALADEMVRDLGNIPRSLAAMIRSTVINTFLTEMKEQDGQRAGKPDRDGDKDKATRDYYRAMSRTEDQHFEKQAKREPSEPSRDGIYFEVIRDGAGKIKGIRARE